MKASSPCRHRRHHLRRRPRRRRHPTVHQSRPSRRRRTAPRIQTRNSLPCRRRPCRRACDHPCRHPRRRPCHHPCRRRQGGRSRLHQCRRRHQNRRSRARHPLQLFKLLPAFPRVSDLWPGWPAEWAVHTHKSSGSPHLSLTQKPLLWPSLPLRILQRGFRLQRLGAAVRPLVRQDRPRVGQPNLAGLPGRRHHPGHRQPKQLPAGEPLCQRHLHGVSGARAACRWRAAVHAQLQSLAPASTWHQPAPAPGVCWLAGPPPPAPPHRVPPHLIRRSTPAGRRTRAAWTRPPRSSTPRFRAPTTTPTPPWPSPASSPSPCRASSG